MHGRRRRIRVWGLRVGPRPGVGPGLVRQGGAEMRGIVGFVDRPQLSCSWWRSAPGPGHRRLGRPATTRGALLRTGAVGVLVALVLGTLGPVGLGAPAAALTVPHHATYSSALSTGSAGTVWLCRPGTARRPVHLQPPDDRGPGVGSDLGGQRLGRTPRRSSTAFTCTRR